MQDDRKGESSPLLEVRHLSVQANSLDGPVPIIRDASFAIARRETVAMVGASGSGKSMCVLAAFGLLPGGVQCTAGEMLFRGRRYSLSSPQSLRHLRGRRVGFIFQNPHISLNPVLRIETQLLDVLMVHSRLSRRAAKQQARTLLQRVDLKPADHVLRAYAHQLSGGMAQRVAIALALAPGPDLLIADEPTTALDVTTQARILSLLQYLQQENNFGLWLITHDPEIVEQMADRVLVLQNGRLFKENEKRRHPVNSAVCASGCAA